MKDRHPHLTKGTHDKRHEKSRYAIIGNLSRPGRDYGAGGQYRHSAGSDGNFGAGGGCSYFDWPVTPVNPRVGQVQCRVVGRNPR